MLFHRECQVGVGGDGGLVAEDFGIVFGCCFRLACFGWRRVDWYLVGGRDALFLLRILLG